MQQTQTKQIYNFIKANKFATAQQVADALAITSANACKMLYAMEQRNYVQQVKLEGLRAMYVANKNVKLNKKRARKATVAKAKPNTNASIVMQAREAIAQLNKLILQLA